jgi:hypothetical protein
MGWNRSQLVERDLFVKEFLSIINKDFKTTEKLDFFYISKNYTIATNEVKDGNMVLAKHYFDKANKYAKELNENSEVLFKLCNNVYFRSFSLYLYKKDDLQSAKDMIINSMQNNEQILENNVEYLFLTFDTAQQYLNLSQLFHGMGKPNVAKRIYIEVINYLINGESKKLPFLRDLNISNESNNYKNLRTILFLETILSFYTKIIDESNIKKEFYLHSNKIMDNVILEKSNITDLIILMIKSKCNRKIDDLKYYQNYAHLNHQPSYQKYFQSLNTLLERI